MSSKKCTFLRRSPRDKDISDMFPIVLLIVLRNLQYQRHYTCLDNINVLKTIDPLKQKTLSTCIQFILKVRTKIKGLNDQRVN